MPRQFYCEYCGRELTITRKVLKNKGVIVDLVSLHACDEKCSASIEDSKTPVEKHTHISADKRLKLNDEITTDGDKRDKQFLRSTAPAGILGQISTSSLPEGSRFEDMED